MFYFEIKTNKGFCWIKHDNPYCVERIEASLLADKIIESNEVIEYIIPRTAEQVGEFNLKAFTYTLNEEFSD